MKTSTLNFLFGFGWLIYAGLNRWLSDGEDINFAITISIIYFSTSTILDKLEKQSK